mmetsp:Transcript_6041/g.19522  ORF Transcript_6041/g.19522 Transcript_6041/m.19522 type:complete len:168 (-) Transcript_6041:63-566(-)
MLRGLVASLSRPIVSGIVGTRNTVQCLNRQNVMIVNPCSQALAPLMQLRSMVLVAGKFRSGSHYHNDSMVNAPNPELPKDPVLSAAACRIFGTSPTSNPHQRSVRKLLLKPLIGEAVASYYPNYPVHNKFGYEDPHFMRAQSKLERLRRRGKGPPKKGQGKRAMKKK